MKPPSFLDVGLASVLAVSAANCTGPVYPVQGTVACPADYAPVAGRGEEDNQEVTACLSTETISRARANGEPITPQIVCDESRGRAYRTLAFPSGVVGLGEGIPIWKCLQNPPKNSMKCPKVTK